MEHSQALLTHISLIRKMSFREVKSPAKHYTPSGWWAHKSWNQVLTSSPPHYNFPNPIFFLTTQNLCHPFMQLPSTAPLPACYSSICLFIQYLPTGHTYWALERNGPHSAVSGQQQLGTVRNADSCPTPVLKNQNLWGWNPTIRDLTRLPGDSDVCINLRITALKE